MDFHAAERLLPTVRSRTRAIPLRVPDQTLAMAQLKALGVPAQAASLWLNRCAGALRFALRLAQASSRDASASDEAVAEVALLDALLAALPAGERMDALALARSCETLIKGDQSGLRLALLIDWLQRWILDLQLARLGAAPSVFPELQPTLETLSQRINDEALMAFPATLIEARRLSSHPLNIRLFLESLFSRVIGIYTARA